MKPNSLLADGRDTYMMTVAWLLDEYPDDGACNHLFCLSLRGHLLLYIPGVLRHGSGCAVPSM